MCVHDVNLVIGEPLLIDAIEPFDVCVAARFQFGPVQCARLCSKSVVGSFLDRVMQTGSGPHDLLWHTADVDTRATHPAGLLKVIFKNRYKLVRVGIYIAMGWLITFASSDLVASLSETALNLTIAGGIVYTAGVAFYLADRIPYMHSVWHLFVIGGSACHFSAIYYGVLPHTA